MEEIFPNEIIKKRRLWLDQLKVILWKNVIIRKRHWFLTLCESLVPVLLFLLIAYGRSKITSLSKQEIVDVTYSEKYPISYEAHGFNLEETQLYYTPADEYFSDIVHRVQEKFQLINNNIQGFNSEQKLLEHYVKTNNYTVVAIVFNSKPDSAQFDYTIRHHKQFFNWQTDKLYANEFIFAPGVGSRYIWEGFLTLQQALDTSFIEKELEKRGSKMPQLSLESQEFPYPPYKSDSGISDLFIHYMPLVTLFSFIFVCPAVLKRVVEEKYTGIKELMRMVGMKSWMVWLGWFIYSILPMILSVLLIVIILKVDLFKAGYPPIEFTSFTILFVFLLLYCITVTINCFFLSTLFYKPSLATLVGIMVWILSYFVPKYINDENTIVPSTAMLMMIFPNMALHFGYAAISNYEVREIGVQWTNLHIPGGNGTTEITMLNVFLMLVFDCFLYMVLTLYIDGLNPGKYGVPKTFWFPLKGLVTSLRGLFGISSGRVNSENTDESAPLEDGNYTEGIRLVGLTKRYGAGNAVVNGLTLGIPKNRITVLLGHNGAGKTTTMGMITGMIKKTSGKIYMNGREVCNNDELAQSIGLCPQHNLFFPDLTVAEHLKFFALLKGKTCSEADNEIDILLNKLEIEEKRNNLAHTLSGGMKRKLCLGMAVIGGSEILILDEPSSGMDPQSRRFMWDLLLKWRRERTILITTHFMEEADALGDYIAIMDEGNLKCCGTPMDLKKNYDTGSHLILLIKQKHDVMKTAAKIKEMIKDDIPDVKQMDIDGNELKFLLPSGDYIKMFDKLERNKEMFHIANISFTNTTLEDVFLSTNMSEKSEKDWFTDFVFAQPECDGQYIVTVKALIFKKIKFFLRNLLLYLWPFLVALAFLILCIYLGQGASDYSSKGGPSLKLSLESYGSSTVFIKTTQNTDVLEMTRAYNRTVAQSGSRLQIVDNVADAIVEEGKRNLPFYRRHMIVAAELSEKRLHGKKIIEGVLLYNDLAKHSAPISLNLFTDSVAKLLLGKEYSISATNHPLDTINSQTAEDQLSEVQIGLLWLIILPMGYLVFLGSFIYFPFMEVSTKFTQIQFMCGLTPCIYWVTMFVFDLILYALFALVMCVLTMVWTPFQGTSEFVALFVILFLYGISAIPYSYLFARKKSFSAAYSLFIILGIMLGVVLTLVVTVLEESGDPDYIETSDILRVVYFILFPQFGLTYNGVMFARKAVSNYNFDHMHKLKRLSFCSRDDASPCCNENGPACSAHRSYLKPLESYIYYIIISCILYLFISSVADSFWLKKAINVIRTTIRNMRYKDTYVPIKEDNSENMNTLSVKKLQKYYANQKVVDLNHLNLPKGECVGILGVNGAGKTTTFKMLTREEVKDNGSITINGVSVNSDGYLKKLGYCPQNDALNFSLTGRDILKTMAMLRQVQNEDEMVNNFLEIFDLEKVADIPCSQYSGGNKRKLSFAVALIGFPQFVLLDEPTNGVDPISRRKFWSVIRKVKNDLQNSFIITSHSMSECEAVCNNVKIMNGGTIKKEGTISQLKNEMDGYSVMLKLRQKQPASLVSVESSNVNEHRNRNKRAHSRESSNSIEMQDINQERPPSPYDEVDGVECSDDRLSVDSCDNITTLDELKTYIKEKFQGVVRDEHSGLLHFYIKSQGPKSWSHLFRRFEELKKNSNLIEDYTISEASLEDVFLAVAKENEVKKTEVEITN